MSILAAVILSDRKLYSMHIAVEALLAEPLVDHLYVNIQTSRPGLYAPLIGQLQRSGKRHDVDMWSIHSSTYLRAPEYDQDQARLGPIVMARNMALDVAMHPQYSHILFVDSDVRPHPSSVQRLLDLDKPITGGYVPGRGVHKNDHYVFGIREQQKYGIRCAHGTCGFMLIQRHVYEVLRFRYGPHPIKRSTMLSEDPAFAADAEAMGLSKDWWIDVRATADHVDDAAKPLTLDNAINDYTAEF